MQYGNNMYGGMPPSNNLWVGNNYSQMPRNNYPQMNQNNLEPSFIQTQMRQPSTNILRVMGPESAQAYQIGPDSQVILMDANEPYFYIKQTDSSGYSIMRAFSFQEIPWPLNQSVPLQNQEHSVNQEYVTKSDFEDFKKMIEDLVMKNE